MSLSKTCRMVSGWIRGGKREPSLPPDIRLQESVVQCGRCVRPLNLSRAANKRMSVAPVNTVILSREVPFFYCQSEVSVEVGRENPAWHAKKNNMFRLVHCNSVTHKRIILYDNAVTAVSVYNIYISKQQTKTKWQTVNIVRGGCEKK